VNFAAHAVVAMRAGHDDPSFILGSMLPDLAPMAGLRIDIELPPGVEAGRRFHHRADAAFHGSSTFVTGLARLRADLEAAGVARGARRGAAHAGYELLLDGALEWTPADDGLFRAALAEGAGALDEPRWHLLLERLATADVPARWRDLDLVTELVEAILARRPRLAMAAGDGPALRAALGAAQPQVAAAAPGLVGEVVQAVR
jgi:acyl carrier protein phosphodiesterase